MRPLRIAVLIKQVPRFESMALGPGGRLVREGLELAINNDPDALVFDCADIGIVADWHRAVPLLVATLHGSLP
jgi:hypothetical protein